MAIYLPFESQIKDIETCSTLLKKELDISTVTARLLVNRGITRIDEAKSFLYPSLDQLHDPFLLSDMDKAVQRLEKAIVDKEAIVIYGDYDVDGITAASILYLFLINKGANVEVYIPDRYQEGYGLNCQAIKHISKGGANLIVTVDCGITAFEEVELANKLGMDIIITDHHKCCNQLPNALAIINPLHHGYSYPFPHLAGVGVAAKVIEAMAGIEEVKKYLDLIALGTVADVVPLVDENRILVAKGLEMINHSPHPGIKALIQVSGLEDRIIDAGKIAFTLAPRLNAAGRISTAYLGFNLLSTQDYHEARHIAQKLDEENRQRQRIETELVDVCKKRILKHGSLCCDKIIVLEGQDWHTGVIGIAASKLVETFHRPCILISIQEDIGVGSARSIPGFNIYNALNQFSSLFIRFGGHEAAAGFTMAKDNIPTLKQKLSNYTNHHMDDSMLVPRYYYDGMLSPQDITPSLIKEIQGLAPFGMGNPIPKFMFNKAILENCRAVGNKGQHLKMALSVEQRLWDAIGFGLGDNKKFLTDGLKKVDFLAVLEENEWMGVRKIQLNIKSMKPALSEQEDIDAFLHPFYFKFYDAFFVEIMYNNDNIDSNGAESQKPTVHPMSKEEMVRCFQYSQLGNLILANTPEGGRWALNLLLEHRIADNIALSYGSCQETWKSGINGMILAPLTNKIPYRHYRRILLLDEELSLYPRLSFLMNTAGNIHMIKGWNNKGPSFSKTIREFKVDRKHFVALYKWLRSRRLGENLWPQPLQLLSQFNQATAQNINGFQLRLILGVFEELNFIKVDSQQSYLKVRCIHNPQSRELIDSILYQRYEVWFNSVLAHCE